jgi:heme exporter protein C
MLISMLIMAFAFWAYTIAISLARVRSIILERERDTQWVSELPEIKQ